MFFGGIGSWIFSKDLEETPPWKFEAPWGPDVHIVNYHFLIRSKNF